MYIGKKNADNTSSRFRAHKYGKMGEVTENNRTFVLPNESQPYSFKMKYSYDSWNRVQTITYPDGEIVYYKYNTGGMLRQVYGRRSFTTGNDSIVPGPFDPLIPRQGDGPTADDAPELDTTVMGERATYHNYYYYYIDSIRYNEFEMKSGQWYGNGTHAHYRYDILQRLDSLKLYDVNGYELQKIKYTYDKANNITQISNAAGTTSSLGGQYSCRYEYDSLYRLITATDTSLKNGVSYGRYAQTMSYDAAGRILSKSDQTWVNGTSLSSVSNLYYYNGNQPHTLSSTVNQAESTSYRWDANGNMTEASSTRPRRLYYSLEWDEENRLRLADMHKTLQCAYYQYDASGERFYKNVGDITNMTQNGETYARKDYRNPTLYASPYVVIANNSYTKHYFAENERFASRIGDGDFADIGTHTVPDSILAAKQTLTNNAAPRRLTSNKFSFLNNLTANWSSHHTTYWQHPDHLGSASWVTDTNGRGYQHLQYRAWGEPFIDQRTTTNGYETRYTFSGKERDEETGFSYFGARHYHSDLSIWLSVDPLADKYPGVSPYVYCGNNPIILGDPHGDSVAVLLANSLPVFGHMAILIQAHGGENDGKWALWSKNGENKSSSNSVTSDDDMGTQYWNSPQEFIKNNNEQYVEAFVLPTNTEQDKKITDGFKKSESKNYNFFYANCAVAVQDGLKNAGLNDGRLSSGQKIALKLTPISLTRKLFIELAPVNIFKRIRKQNPNGVWIKKR